MRAAILQGPVVGCPALYGPALYGPALYGPGPGDLAQLGAARPGRARL
jgi:hypothetical protein